MFRILGSLGGANSQQAHDVVTTSMRRYDVAATTSRHHVIRINKNVSAIGFEPTPRGLLK